VSECREGNGKNIKQHVAKKTADTRKRGMPIYKQKKKSGRKARNLTGKTLTSGEKGKKKKKGKKEGELGENNRKAKKKKPVFQVRRDGGGKQAGENRGMRAKGGTGEKRKNPKKEHRQPESVKNGTEQGKESR